MSLENTSSSTTATLRWSSVKVFRPPIASSSSVPSGSSLPRPRPPPSEEEEEELKPTPDELKQAYASVITGRNGPDAPLMTKAMRDRQEARLGVKQKKTFDSVRIRLRFSDRTQIEALFSSFEKIVTVYQFLRSSIRSDLVKTPVTIFQTLPRMEYKLSDVKVKSKSLAQLGLAPAAILNVRWDDCVEMNATTYPAPLDLELAQTAQDIPPPPSFDSPSQSIVSSSSSPPTASSSTTQSTTAKPIPKWLKNLAKK